MTERGDSPTLGSSSGYWGPSPTQLSLDAHDKGGGRVVVVGGEIDVATAVRLEAFLDQEAAAHPGAVLVLDLSEVAFLGSACLRALVTAHHRYPLRVVAASRVVLRPIEVTGLDELLDLYGTVADAVADLADPPTPALPA